jgi:hypothetical protein
MEVDTEETFDLVQVKLVVGTKDALDELEDDLVNRRTIFEKRSDPFLWLNLRETYFWILPRLCGSFICWGEILAAIVTDRFTMETVS